MNGQDEITFFAKTNFRNQEVPFGIKTDDRRRHMYVIGKTGMGKTTMMENMVIQDIRNGHGVCFIDPHGDSVMKILNFVPNNRINDVVYLNPSDLDFPIAFNILESVDPKYKHLVASGLMGVFTKIWANLWSARMEYILNNTILALLESPGNTMLGIVRMYVDKKYRKKIVDNVKDPIVRAFWTDEFANYAEKYRTEAVAPIQNKVGQFLSSAIVRNIVGQPKSTLDLREIMDNQKILIIDLSKGKVGEDNSALLGAMIITKLQLAALSRVDIPEKERKDFYLYVDEFQNFVTESFATILSEARKYRLNLTIGHQYVGQLVVDRNTKVRDAVFGNVGTIVSFRVGAEDAELLEKEYEPHFTMTDIINLPKYNIILKLMINGVASDPFSAITLPPDERLYTGNGDKVVKVSRERYGNPLVQVEEKISRWMGAEFHEQAALTLTGEASPRTSGNEELELEDQPLSKPLTSPLPATPTPPKPQAPETETLTPKPLLTFSAPQPPAERATITPSIKRAEPVQPVPVKRTEPSRATRPTYSTQPRRPDTQQSRFSPRPAFKRTTSNPQRKPFKSQPAKKENPIWQTVQSLEQQKIKKLEEEFDTIVNQQHSPTPNVKPTATPSATTIEPGEVHTF
jgi:hypothetical protein